MKIDILIAASLNGSISVFDNDGKSLFSKCSDKTILKIREKIRDKYDAIMVGVNTLIRDNPNLLNKNKNNKRLIIDKYNNLPLNLKIFTNNPRNTIVIISKTDSNGKYLLDIMNTGVSLLFVENINDPVEILRKVEENGIQNVLLEGGAKIINDFFRYDLINFMHIVFFPFFASDEQNNIFLQKIDRTVFVKNIFSKRINKKYVFVKYKFC